PEAHSRAWCRAEPRRAMNRRMDVAGKPAPVYCACVLCPARRRAQTLPLALKSDHGDAAATRRAGPPSSGKPEGCQASPLEPRVQGRFARIAMAEDVLSMATARRSPRPQGAGFLRSGAMAA